MKIYTKTGDSGETSLVGGKRISKSHIRLEAYGSVDELNSVIGSARANKTGRYVDAILESLQNDLFDVGSRLACVDKKFLEKLPHIKNFSIELMESSIDEMTKKLPPLKNFILPGGHPSAALLHQARTVCRRAERCIIRLKEAGEDVDPLAIVFLNRLSDCLFVMARFVNFKSKIKDVLWNSKRRER